MNGHNIGGRAAAPPRWWWTRAGVCAACVAGLLLAGCATGGTADSDRASKASAQRWSPTAGVPDAGGRPEFSAATALSVDIGHIDRSDPDATARAALMVWFSWNPNVDSGPNNAAARAAPLLSAPLRDSITGTAPVRSPGAQWLRWAQQRATASVRVDPGTEAVPPQTPTEAIRVYVVTQNWFGPAGEPIEVVVHKVGVVLRATKSVWEVHHVEQR